ncbi:DUF429 domain-containing protein [Nocardioides gansuensis]|uniref:DUF429 domain-containing protein n=1 Tax=Nocardioides gansuensis TaxID=2138300 RepID=UPI001402616F|nr:DUF429 domain-containing protein [Nocardioides gansuensis]
MFLGIDLGWTTGSTGLALVDLDGAFVDSTTVKTDEEIAAWVEGLPAAVVVAAVDAPLIVTNPTGQRVAEREITTAFGRFKAGTHPTNLAKPGMDPPRAARLAERFGWTKVARQGTVESPACIEVYPHPAMVALFGLAERLRYKDKRAFTLETRQDGFAHLLDSLEGISVLALSGNRRWEGLRRAVEGAMTRAALNRVEDELDAILCAHLAWLWQTSPGSLQVYGDPETGYIVAPPPVLVPPAAHVRPADRIVVEIDPGCIDSVREAIARLEGVRRIR